MQFTCPECGKTFQTKTGLSNHSRSHKRKLPETRSSAAIPKSVDSLAEGGQTHAELQNHVTRANVLAHDREPCNVTTKSKDESSQGMGSGGHMVVHPGYKELRTDDVVSVESRVISDSYACGECGKAFASARSLGSHKKIHFKHSSLDSAGTRRSSFQTSTIVATDTFTGSDRSFQRLAQRQTDVEFAVNLNDEKDKWERASSISIEKKEKDSYSCKECGKEFSSAQSLGSHKKVHFKNSSFNSSSGRLSSLKTPTSSIEDREEPSDDSLNDTSSFELTTNLIKENNKSETEGFPTTGQKGAKNMCNECNQTFPTKRGLANHRRVHKWRENPKKSVDTWEPPEENGCGKVDKDGDGILSTTAKTGNEYDFKQMSENSHHVNGLNADNKSEIAVDDFCDHFERSTSIEVKSNYEGSMSTGSQNDADDSSGDENFVMPSQAEISNLVETFEQSLIVKDEDVLASNQEISTADQNFQSFSKNNICSDENDDDDEENDEEESFYSLSDDDADLSEEISLDDNSNSTLSPNNKGSESADSILSRLSTPTLAEKLREDRTPTITKEARQLDQMVKKNKVTRKEKGTVATAVKDLIRSVLDELKKDSPDLKWDKFHSGSYYDNTKNEFPDEFDFMIYPKAIQVKVDFDSPSAVGFYKVKVESPRLDDNFKCMMHGEYLHPKQYKDYVFGKLDEIFSSTADRKFRSVKRVPKKDDCSPAYTIIYNRLSRPIDIDLVPAFLVKGKCPIARSVNPTWIKNDKVVNEIVRQYDIVAKTCPDEAVVDRDLLWRLSFSNSEKHLIKFAADGNRYSKKKTIFRIMKQHIQTIKNKYPDEVKKICSYHVKQFMLGQFDNEWKDSDMGKVHRAVLKNFIAALSDTPPFIENYFIEGDNVIRFIPELEIDLIVKYCTDQITSLNY